MSARYGVGVGARKGFEAHELAALVQAAAARLGVDCCEATLAALETHQEKERFTRAAALLDMRIAFVPLAALQDRKSDVLTQSERVAAKFGVGSLAETLALVAAGDGSRLVEPRVATGNLTCAIARSRCDWAESPNRRKRDRFQKWRARLLRKTGIHFFEARSRGDLT